MISGSVDRRWAEHHYRRWYREHEEMGKALLHAGTSQHREGFELLAALDEPTAFGRHAIHMAP